MIHRELSRTKYEQQNSLEAEQHKNLNNIEALGLSHTKIREVGKTQAKQNKSNRKATQNMNREVKPPPPPRKGFPPLESELFYS
jgi:transposase-like protein